MSDNQNHELRKRKSKIPTETRQLVIFKYNRSLPASRISSDLGLLRSAIHEIIQLFRTESQILTKKRGENYRTKLSEENKLYNRGLVDNDSTLTLLAIVEQLFSEKHIRVDDSTIARCFSGFHYTLKQLFSIPDRRNSTDTIEKKFFFAEDITQLMFEIEDRNLIFLDEEGFCVVTRTKSERSVLGESPVINVSAIKSRNISAIAASNKYGMIDCHINSNPVTGENFKAHLLNLKIKLLESGIENPVYVFDNARIHHYRGLVEVLNSEGIVLKYLSPYSPMLNIIKNCFSK
ncbi:hypothetical protein CDIK_0346 [Cucumispora dikerogammari]|nr:hypothetical protein CDIK_0346 [Cucumispora dikerogammari]